MTERAATRTLGVAKEALMGIAKVHRYEVHTHGTADRRVALESSGKPSLSVAAPPDFRGGVRGAWSPEELLVGSLATCFELTLTSIAEHVRLPLHAVEIDATGHLEGKAGRYHFVAIELDARVVTDPEREQDVLDLAELVRERCIVENALKTPVSLDLEVEVATDALVPPASQWAW
jgi:organic hydroperoxide reductase OsmC/OhrA